MADQGEQPEMPNGTGTPTGEEGQQGQLPTTGGPPQVNAPLVTAAPADTAPAAVAPSANATDTVPSQSGTTIPITTAADLQPGINASVSDSAHTASAQPQAQPASSTTPQQSTFDPEKFQQDVLKAITTGIAALGPALQQAQ